MTPISDIPNPTPLNTFVPEHLLKPKKQQKYVQEFTDQLFQTISSKFPPTPPKEPTPPRISSIDKEVAVIEEPRNKLVQYQEEGGSDPKMPKINDMKAEKEKPKEELRKLLNPTILKAQAHKWTEHEERKAKMMEEYKYQISFRDNPPPITKISYVVNFKNEATMKITKGGNPLNLIFRPNFRLKTLGFSEWLEVHALTSKKSGTSKNLLLQSLREKIYWVINQAKRLGLSPPPELATFGLTAEEKKRKKTEFLKEAFVTEYIKVDGMDRNLIPPHAVIPIQGKKDQLSAKHQLEVKGLFECKASVSNIRRIQIKDIVKEVKDYLKTYSSAGMDISCLEVFLKAECVEVNPDLIVLLQYMTNVVLRERLKDANDDNYLFIVVDEAHAIFELKQQVVIFVYTRGLYLVTKEDLTTKDELDGFRKHVTSLDALDFLVCLKSDVFVMTHGGNFAKLIIGARRTTWSARLYTDEKHTTLQGHILGYPLQVDADGNVNSLPGFENFAYVGGKVMGAHSPSMPDILTT
nr:protein pectic arabinogalactan synthesis-related isoform X2 [Tanacetum cinerariifolium]